MHHVTVCTCQQSLFTHASVRSRRTRFFVTLLAVV